MPVKNKPVTENSNSRQRGLRIPIPEDDYLQGKAEANPNNRYNQMATEVNDLIAADHAKFKRTGKYTFAKKRP